MLVMFLLLLRSGCVIAVLDEDDNDVVAADIFRKKMQYEQKRTGGKLCDQKVQTKSTCGCGHCKYPPTV